MRALFSFALALVCSTDPFLAVLHFVLRRQTTEDGKCVHDLLCLQRIARPPAWARPLTARNSPNSSCEVIRLDGAIRLAPK